MYSPPIMRRESKTLQQAIVYFSNPDNCLNYLIDRRWPDGVVTCPRCGTDNVRFMASRRTWQCNARHPKAQFSIKVGTIFEDSAIGLDKWLCAMWMLANCKNGVSSWEIHRTIGVTQKTAWFMLQRLRLALQDDESGGKMSGHVEVDETFIGGSARNFHISKRTFRKGFVGKVAVMGLLDRHTRQVRTEIIHGTNRPNIDPTVRKHIEAGSTVYTDMLASYNKLEDEYIHNVINHAEKYVEGNVHTNGIENYWSLLKRGLKGTYVSVEPFHFVPLSR